MILISPTSPVRARWVPQQAQRSPPASTSRTGPSSAFLLRYSVQASASGSGTQQRTGVSARTAALASASASASCAAVSGMLVSIRT